MITKAEDDMTTTTKKIEHLDIAEFTHVEPTTQYPFSFAPTDAANALRRFADQIERGAVALQNVEIAHTAGLNDFQESQLLITYVRKHHEVAP